MLQTLTYCCVERSTAADNLLDQSWLHTLGKSGNFHLTKVGTIGRNPYREGVESLAPVLHSVNFCVVEIHACDQVDGPKSRINGWNVGTERGCWSGRLEWAATTVVGRGPSGSPHHEAT